MRKNILDVIDAFKARRSLGLGDRPYLTFVSGLNPRAWRGRGESTCSTDGERIYSYLLCIAVRHPNGLVQVISEEHQSRTTVSQIRAIRSELRGQILCDHEDCLKEFAEGTGTIALACAVKGLIVTKRQHHAISITEARNAVTAALLPSE